MGRGISGSGDRLASGRARSAQFVAGGAKKDDKVQINKGILASPEDVKTMQKEAAKLATVATKPVMQRIARPLYDRILVRPATVEEVTKGGIVIPEEAKDRPREGTVVRVGKGKRDINGVLWTLDVKPGDTVLFGQYAGTEVKIDGEVVLMMREEEVLAVIE